MTSLQPGRGGGKQIEKSIHKNVPGGGDHGGDPEEKREREGKLKERRGEGMARALKSGKGFGRQDK